MSEAEEKRPGAGLLFVTGGAKSGKTRRALEFAEATEPPAGKLLYVATAEVRDSEMDRRVAAHKAERGPRWATLEEPLDLAGAVSGAEDYCALMIDCLTLWCSNLLEAHGDDEAAIEARVDAFIEALSKRQTKVVVVTNEVGLGIVPANALARRFRDLAGAVNQRVCAIADEAVMVVSGRLLRLE